jgi:hypothetical protein
MKRLLDWLLALAVVTVMLGAGANCVSNDEIADARRDREAAAEMKLLVDGMK